MTHANASAYGRIGGVPFITNTWLAAGWVGACLTRVDRPGIISTAGFSFREAFQDRATAPDDPALRFLRHTNLDGLRYRQPELAGGSAAQFGWQ
jgi:hypothetical protein